MNQGQGPGANQGQGQGAMNQDQEQGRPALKPRGLIAARGLVVLVAILVLLSLAARHSPAFAFGIVLFVVGILISVILHEAGHFLTAKKFGMKATQFFVGFGPTLWSTVRGETEYGVKALPFGAFVRITGMTTLDEVDSADEPRSMRNKPAWQRAIVMVAGSFMHFALAFVLLLFLAIGIGQANDNTTTIGSISSCVPASLKAFDQGSCADNRGTAPAKSAGIKPGDKIIAIDGKPVHNWTQLGTAIRAQSARQKMAVTVERDGQTLTLHATPATVPGRNGSYLGIGDAVIFTRSNPIAALTFAGSAFGEVLTGSAEAFAKLPAALPDLFAKDRAKTPAANVSSMVGAADIAGQAVASSGGWRYAVSDLLLILISINIFIGAINLLPLLPLDGGHLAVIFYERIRAWLARLRGKPDPGLVDLQKLIPVSVGVFALLIGLGVLLMAADIFNPVHLVQ
jgi:membrane-associated protease RseP (regulator of RpoE activity)